MYDKSTGATNINANSIGSVTPTTNAEIALAKTIPILAFVALSQHCDTLQVLRLVYQTS